MEKVNLFKLYEDGIVKDGGHNVSVPIKKANGDNYNGQTYSIPLKYLYYNEQNGRIGVSLSDYESVSDKLIPGHNEEYNCVIQEMLADDNSESTRKAMADLKRDIAMKGQDEPGYVLSDGRVIDGNRRFTARRLLEQDPSISEQQYFEAVILDDLSVQNHDDQKKIKSLELQIQFGRLGKVDYNPIDRAIDAYKTIVVNNIMSVNEYTEYADLKSNEVNKLILEAELIVKFLEFSNTKSDNYALAKQLDLDGPLQDMVPQYRKMKGSDNLDQLLNSLFAKIIQMRASKEDFKTEFREIVKNVVGTNNEDKFVEDMEDATDVIVEALDEKAIIRNNIDLFETLNSNKETVKAMAEVRSITTNHSEKAKNYKEQTKPINLAEKAFNSIEAIDKRIVSDLPTMEKEKLRVILEKLNNYTNALLSEED